MGASIDITPEVTQNGSATSIGFTTLTPEGQTIRIYFAVEELYEPSDLAATEAMLLAAIALAMQRRSRLRVHGKVSRSLRHSIDLYQAACAFWWPHRYGQIPVEVDTVDDQPPATARGILCFSGGVDSIYSARNLAPAKQVDSGLLVAGYDIDPGGGGQDQQRLRVARLLDRLGLSMTVIRTNVRQIMGQKVIEGAQGSYLAAALTLLSDRFGRGFVSSGLIDLVDLGVSDPVHEATMPLLGSSRHQILVYGGQTSRIDKLANVAAEPELYRDVRVCLERANDGHCGRCAKCLLNAFASIALTGEWPPWYPQNAFDVSYVAVMQLTETRRRYGQQILRIAAANGRRGEWRTALESRIETAPRRIPDADPLQKACSFAKENFKTAVGG